MKIFVTGATGKVGSRFAAYLLNQGHSVRAIVRNPEKAAALKEQGAELIEGDLLDNANLTEYLRGTEAVVHIAAQFRGGITEEVARAANLDATIQLAQAALAAGVTRFVFTSTNRIYEGLKLDGPCREDVVLPLPTNPYTRTKRAAEAALHDFHREQGLDLRIMRLPFVYGDRDPHIAEIVPFMKNRNPAQKMSIGHHADVTQALLLAATAPGIGGQTFNVADDYPVSVAELFQVDGQPAQVEPEGGWPEFNQWDNIVDTRKIKQELNFQPIYPSIFVARDKDAL